MHSRLVVAYCLSKFTDVPACAAVRLRVVQANCHYTDSFLGEMDSGRPTPLLVQKACEAKGKEPLAATSGKS